MKVFESAALLVIGTVLLAFSSLSFLLFPHPPRLANPDLLVEAFFVAGLVFAALGIRGMRRIHKALLSNTPKESAETAVA